MLVTFDALSPEHDHPQYLTTMKKWCEEAGLVDVDVQRGGNVIGDWGAQAGMERE